MTKVEEVARAIAKVRAEWSGYDQRDWQQFSDDFWREYQADAYAAIEAMRVPTPEMVEAGCSAHDDTECPETVWSAMIDVALNTPVSPVLSPAEREDGEGR